MIGRQFTWANSLPEPTYEKLDRVLMDSDREVKFPMVLVRALQRIEAHFEVIPEAGTRCILSTSSFHMKTMGSNNSFFYVQMELSMHM